MKIMRFITDICFYIRHLILLVTNIPPSLPDVCMLQKITSPTDGKVGMIKKQHKLGHFRLVVQFNLDLLVKLKEQIILST